MSDSVKSKALAEDLDDFSVALCFHMWAQMAM